MLTRIRGFFILYYYRLLLFVTGYRGIDIANRKVIFSDYVVKELFGDIPNDLSFISVLIRDKIFSENKDLLLIGNNAFLNLPLRMQTAFILHEEGHAFEARELMLEIGAIKDKLHSGKYNETTKELIERLNELNEKSEQEADAYAYNKCGYDLIEALTYINAFLFKNYRYLYEEFKIHKRITILKETHYGKDIHSAV